MARKLETHDLWVSFTFFWIFSEALDEYRQLILCWKLIESLPILFRDKQFAEASAHWKERLGEVVKEWEKEVEAEGEREKERGEMGGIAELLR